MTKPKTFTQLHPQELCIETNTTRANSRKNHVAHLYWDNANGERVDYLNEEFPLPSSIKNFQGFKFLNATKQKFGEEFDILQALLASTQALQQKEPLGEARIMTANSLSTNALSL